MLIVICKGNIIRRTREVRIYKTYKVLFGLMMIIPLLFLLGADIYRFGLAVAEIPYRFRYRIKFLPPIIAKGPAPALKMYLPMK